MKRRFQPLFCAVAGLLAMVSIAPRGHAQGMLFPEGRNRPIRSLPAPIIQPFNVHNDVITGKWLWSYWASKTSMTYPAGGVKVARRNPTATSRK